MTECWLGFWQVRNQLRAEQIARNIREKELREKQKQEEAAAGDEDAAAAAALGIEEPAPPPDPLAYAATSIAGIWVAFSQESRRSARPILFVVETRRS